MLGSVSRIASLLVTAFPGRCKVRWPTFSYRLWAGQLRVLAATIGHSNPCSGFALIAPVDRSRPAYTTQRNDGKQRARNPGAIPRGSFCFELQRHGNAERLGDLQVDHRLVGCGRIAGDTGKRCMGVTVDVVRV